MFPIQQRALAVSEFFSRTRGKTDGCQPRQLVGRHPSTTFMSLAVNDHFAVNLAWPSHIICQNLELKLVLVKIKPAHKFARLLLSLLC